MYSDFLSTRKVENRPHDRCPKERKQNLIFDIRPYFQWMEVALYNHSRKIMYPSWRGGVGIELINSSSDQAFSPFFTPALMGEKAQNA